MKNAKSFINKHATDYISAVFANSLRNNGFSCPNDDLLCWYRKKNDEVINSIIFRSLWPKLPLFLEIGYGIIPFFAMPIQTKSVIYTDYPDEELFVTVPIVENYPNGGTKAPFSTDVQVYAPLQGKRGLYTFQTQILPEMDRIKSIQEAYIFHKNRRLNHPMAKDSPPEKQLGELSKTFIDMSLWVDDREIYHYAVTTICQKIHLFEKLTVKFPQRHGYEQELEAWKRLQRVFDNNERDCYISELTKRASKNSEILQKSFFIT